MYLDHIRHKVEVQFSSDEWTRGHELELRGPHPVSTTSTADGHRGWRARMRLQVQQAHAREGA